MTIDHQLMGRRVSAALSRIRDLSGVSLAFGGEVIDGEVALQRFAGSTVGELAGVRLELGHGLGGKVVVLARTLAVDDYVATTAITHRYDRIIRAEGLRAMVATPVIVARRPVAVLYGALRSVGVIGDRIRDVVTHEARALEQELTIAAARAEPSAEDTDVAAVRHRVRLTHQRLRQLAARVDDDIRADLERICSDLIVTPASAEGPGHRVALTGREIDVLSHAALGLTNAAVAEALGLTVGTVKSYLKAAMTKLGARTRLEAVVAARHASLLP